MMILYHMIIGSKLLGHVCQRCGLNFLPLPVEIHTDFLRTVRSYFPEKKVAVF